MRNDDIEWDPEIKFRKASVDNLDTQSEIFYTITRPPGGVAFHVPRAAEWRSN